MTYPKTSIYYEDLQKTVFVIGVRQGDKRFLEQRKWLPEYMGQAPDDAFDRYRNWCSPQQASDEACYNWIDQRSTLLATSPPVVRTDDREWKEVPPKPSVAEQLRDELRVLLNDAVESGHRHATLSGHMNPDVRRELVDDVLNGVSLPLQAKASVPDGYRLVPEKLTREVRQAFHESMERHEDGDEIEGCPDDQWNAMLAEIQDGDSLHLPELDVVVSLRQDTTKN